MTTDWSAVPSVSSTYDGVSDLVNGYVLPGYVVDGYVTATPTWTVVPNVSTTWTQA